MRTNKRIITGIFVLTILLIPLALADENVNVTTKDNKLSKSYHFSSNDSEVISQVWGKDMTVAEYIETVYPGSLEVLPKDLVEYFKVEPMVWSGINKATTCEKIKNVAKSSESKDGNITPKSAITATSYSGISPVVQGQISFGGFTTTSAPVPYIIINSALHRDNEVNPISTAFDVEAGSAFGAATGVATVSGHHTYFSQSQHEIHWPAGYFPPVTASVTVSPIITT